MRVHVVIDLETMGTGPNASIVQIGAVSFTKERPPSVDRVFVGGMYSTTPYIVPAFATNVKESTGSIELSTVEWWLRQAEVARTRLSEPGLAEESALVVFSQWVKCQGNAPGPGQKDMDIMPWAHGGFDLTILDSAYRRHGMKVPWAYRNARDLRTAYDPWGINSHEPEFTEDIIPHYALHDALREARALEWTFQQMDELLSRPVASRTIPPSSSLQPLY